MKKIIFQCLLLSSLVWMAIACGSNSPTTPSNPTATPTPGVTNTPTATATPPTLTFLYNTYISVAIGSSSSCASCHSSPGAYGVQVNASTKAAFYSSMVNEPSADGCATTFVVPGNANQSTLYLRLSGSCGTPNDRMPYGGPSYLTAAQLAQFAAWINAGALNN